MYSDYSIYLTDKQLRWSQAEPKRYSAPLPILCNGRNLIRLSWTDSQQSHKALGYKLARCTEYRLLELLEHYSVIHGCIKRDYATPDEWRDLRETFGEYAKHYRKSTGHDFRYIAKQHITMSEAGDDMHYDYIAYTDAPLRPKKLAKLVLSWWRAAGAQRYGTTAKVAPKNAERYRTIAGYTFKDECRLSNIYLPKKRAELDFHATWTSRGANSFWGRQRDVMPITYKWNGELVETERELDGIEQVWREWKLANCGSEPPELVTADYLTAQQTKKQLEQITGGEIWLP